MSARNAKTICHKLNVLDHFVGVHADQFHGKGVLDEFSFLLHGIANDLFKHLTGKLEPVVTKNLVEKHGKIAMKTFGTPGYMCFDRADVVKNDKEDAPFMENDKEMLGALVSAIFSSDSGSSDPDNKAQTNISVIVNPSSVRYFIFHPSIKISCSSCNTSKNITKWMDEILAYSSPHLEIVVVGNKSDLISSVTDDMIQSKLVGDWATRFPGHPIQFVKTSAKNNINIENAFFTLATSIKSRMVHQSIVQSRSAHIQYSKKGIQNPTRKSCGC